MNGSCCVSLVGFQFKNIKFADYKLPALADFEQIDLRVHVKRFDGAKWRKGSVVISRILDNTALKILSKILLNSNSRTSATSSNIEETENVLRVKYSWISKDNDQQLWVRAKNLPSPYNPKSETAFFLERPYEYSALGDDNVREIEISHSQWHTYEVTEYALNIDFAMEFGAEFSMLSSVTPHSFILAEGSTVAIKDNGNI